MKSALKAVKKEKKLIYGNVRKQYLAYEITKEIHRRDTACWALSDSW